MSNVRPLSKTAHQCPSCGVPISIILQGAATSAPAPAARSASNPGEYIVRFGQKYGGRKLKSIPRHDLRSYCEWFISNSEKTGKPLSDQAIELIEMADAYLKG